MNADMHQKVTADHLKRDAYLYIRQSSIRQVFENTESTQRQYALRQRAVALGWPSCSESTVAPIQTAGERRSQCRAPLLAYRVGKFGSFASPKSSSSMYHR